MLRRGNLRSKNINKLEKIFIINLLLKLLINILCKIKDLKIIYLIRSNYKIKKNTNYIRKKNLILFL
jgi:hypothetical protein